MYKSRFRKVLGDVWARKGRTLLVAVSIMIGVFGVVTMVGVTDLVMNQLREDLKADEIATAHIYVTSTGQAVSLEDNWAYMESIAQLPGVDRIEGQAAYQVSWQTVDAVNERFNDSTIIAFTEDFEDVTLEPVARVLEGRYPEPGQNEIAVETRFAEKYDVTVGDVLLFRQVGEEKPVVQEWSVVGRVLHPYLSISVTAQDLVPQEERIYAHYEDAQLIAGFPGLSAFYVRHDSYASAQSGQRDLMRTITAETPYIALFPFLDDPENNFLIQQVGQINSVLNMLGIIAMVVSGFLVTNVINTIVVEQKQQIGVMKSMGATRWDTLVIYGGIALIYGVIGTITGVLLGVPAAGTMAQEVAPLALTYIEGFSISVNAILIGVAMGLLVPVLAAFLPALNATRVSILDAMTDLGISSNWGKSRIARFIGWLPLPINMRQALSNIIQKRGRLLLTTITLTLAIAAFMGVTAVFASLGDTVRSIFDTFNYEVQLSPQVAQEFERVETLVVDNFDEVERLYAGYSLTVSIEGYANPNPDDPFGGGDGVIAIGIEPASPTLAFDLAEGAGWEQDPSRQGVIITRAVADVIDKGIGDEIVVSISGNRYSYEIIGVDRYPFPSVYFDWRELATIAGYVNDTGQPLAGSFYLVLDQSRDWTVREIDNLIADMNDIMVDNGIQATFVNQPQIAEDQVEQINVFGLIFNITSAVMAAVGAVGLLATLSMSVFERQKEIGVMRSIGAGSVTITTQFLVEGILVGIIAWLIGVPLSVLLATGLAQSLGFEDFFRFEFPPEILLQGLMGIIVIATVASLWPSIGAARKTVSEILRYQ
ncbi:MAG: FtsX-like permease family protein [Chloroflexota bacterium]